MTGYIFDIYCHWPKYSFVWYPCHMSPVELWESSCRSKISKGAIKE